MNEILGAVLDKGAGAGAAGGIMQLAFGRNEQLEADKYTVKTEDDGRKFMTTIFVVGGLGTVALIILIFAFRKS